MNSSFHCAIPLRQHTPLIHFQHQQHEALLRMTELKPKLEKFLLTHHRAAIPPHCIRKAPKGDTLACKLHIEVQQHYTEPIGREVKLYFGHVGKNEEEYLQFTRAEGIELHCFCYDTALTQLIRSTANEFFLTHNFGMRQSKGFGSFTIQDPDPACLQGKGYQLDIDTGLLNNSRQHHASPFERFTILLDMFHRSLRSGLNYSYGSGFYMKPMIWQYFMQMPGGVKWEKKKVKEQFFSGELRQQLNDYPDPDFPVAHRSNNELLIKDLLGLSTTEDWKHYGTPTPKIVKDLSGNTIKRFQTPFLYKPLVRQGGGYRVYILPKPQAVLNGMLGHSFTIQHSGSGQEFPISTPAHFNLTDFFRFVLSQKSEAALRPRCAYTNTPEFQYLTSLYQTLTPL